MAQAGEKYVTQEVWWNPAQAVNFLRDGTTPSATELVARVANRY